MLKRSCDLLSNEVLDTYDPDWEKRVQDAAGDLGGVNDEQLEELQGIYITALLQRIVEFRVMLLI